MAGQRPEQERLSLRDKLKQLAKKTEKRLLRSHTFDFKAYNKGDNFEEYILYKADLQCLTRGDIINLASRKQYRDNNFCAAAIKHLDICKACREELLNWIIFYIKTVYLTEV